MTYDILNQKKLGSPLVTQRVKIIDSESQPLVEQDDYLAGICEDRVRALSDRCKVKSVFRWLEVSHALLLCIGQNVSGISEKMRLEARQ